MYDWRIPCHKAARRFALTHPSLTFEAKDFGHLEHFHYGGERVCMDIIESLNLKSSDRILDAGCGIGGSARTLSRLNHPIIGVDSNPDFIHFAGLISTERFVSDCQPVFEQSRLEDLEGLQYDAWFALLVFVHITDRSALFQKLERDCSSKGRYFIEAIASGSKNELFKNPIWTMAQITTLMPLAHISCKTEQWKYWTRLRLERFLARRRFFVELYGTPVFEKRARLYEKVAEGFQSGVLNGLRLVGESGSQFHEKETDLEKTCIIEFDQFLDIK